MLTHYGNTTVLEDWHVNERIPPGFSRIYYVRGGRTEYRDEYRRFGLRAGYLYIFPNAAPYSIKHDPSDPLRCTFMHLHWFPVVVTEPVALPAEEDGLMFRLLSAFTAAVDGGNHKIIAALGDAFETFFRETGAVSGSAPPALDVLPYIANNLHRELRVEDLARRCGYHPQYFIRLFSRAMGMSPHQYIINARLREALRLLKSELPVTAVSEQCGYRDLKTFSRAFREKFGLSPTAYRSMGPPLLP